MAEEDVLDAQCAEDLGPILEVLKDQEFHYANLHHDAKGRTFALSILKKFPPRKGNWVLDLRGVGAVAIDHQGNHRKDTLRSLLWDPDRKVLTVKCVQDEIRISVDSLDLRATRHGQDGPAKKFRFEDLPEKLRKEIQQQRDEEDGARVRSAEVTRGLLVKATVSAAMFSLALGAYQALLGEGRGFVDLVLLPATSAATAWFCIATGRDQLTTSLVFGMPALLLMCAALTVLHQGTLLIAFCGGLLHIVAGAVLVIWMKGEREMRA